MCRSCWTPKAIVPTFQPETSAVSTTSLLLQSYYSDHAKLERNVVYVYFVVGNLRGKVSRNDVAKHYGRGMSASVDSRDYSWRLSPQLEFNQACASLGSTPTNRTCMVVENRNSRCRLLDSATHSEPLSHSNIKIHANFPARGTHHRAGLWGLIYQQLIELSD